MATQLHILSDMQDYLKAEVSGVYVVYVLNKEGKPLMPTVRFGHVRRLLKSGKAKAVSTRPFVIQLQYETTKYVQPLYGGTDPGRTNIGEAVVNGKGEVVYAAHVTTRNKDISKKMGERKAHRQASRRGERLRRKRRAIRCGTVTTFPEGRRLPGYKDDVLGLKDIINTEAKSNNRKRPKGWLTPTARQCIQTHISMVRRICRILPVSHWTMEYNRFAFMLLEDGSVRGRDFQNGKLKNHDNANDYISAVQKGKCKCCGKPIEHFHHIVPKNMGGSDSPDNIIGLCLKCHHEVHTGKRDLDEIGTIKKYSAASIVNIAMPFIRDELEKMFGENAFICEGKDTEEMRKHTKIEKDHHNDAICIAGRGAVISSESHFHLRLDDNRPFEIVQYRCHDRAIIKSQVERTYKLDGKTVARNRKPRFEQEGDALSDWYAKAVKKHGEREARRMLSRLTVKKSYRRYNSLDRDLPGMIFIFEGKRYIKRSQITNGRYFRAFGEGERNFPARKCRIVNSGSSLTYM